MYKYIYPVKYLKQKDLEGRNHTFKQICGPGHLILELATQPLCHAEDVCMGGG